MIPLQNIEIENIYLRSIGAGIRSLAITSSGRGEGVSAMAVALAQVGRKADAMKRLRDAVSANPDNRILALNDPDFECVRDEPEFIDLVEPEESRGSERPAL